MSFDQLFRNEAAAYQTQRLYGTILLRQSWSASLLTLMFTSLTGLLIFFFFTVGFSRVENLDGLVLPDRGLIRVPASQAGVVVEKKIAEGQRVEAGDTLFVVSHERSTRRGETHDSVIEALTARISSLRHELIHAEHQAESKLKALQRKREEILARHAALDADVELQKKRLQLAQEVERRYETLARENFISPLQVQEKAALALEQHLALNMLQRTREGLRGDLDGVAGEIRDIPLVARRDAATLARSIHDSERELAESEARRQVLVRAATAGVVSAVSVELGQSVSQAEFLAALEPAGSILEAVFYAPTRAVGFARPGTSVELRFDAFPYEKFGLFRGTVKEVSATPVLPSELPGSSRGDGDAVRYRVRVAIDAAGLGPAIHLKAGMRAQAALLLERRKLYEWAFKPLLQIAERSL